MLWALLTPVPMMGTWSQKQILRLALNSIIYWFLLLSILFYYRSKVVRLTFFCQLLIESNKALAETIGKIVVRCLYHRSGCTWQGPLSDCTSHCPGCAFGNSPVVCNRCGVQIVHRQVQEHAQSCSVSALTLALCFIYVRYV